MIDFNDFLKNRRGWKQVVLIAMLLASAGADLSRAVEIEPYRARVVSVTDGDTVKVLDEQHHQHKVRLQGIDAPEKAQPFGQRSRASLAAMVLQKDVWVDTHKHDRYGREVGRLLLDDVDVDLEQVRRGMAWHYKAYAREQTPEQRQSYAASEEQAREAQRGLWADPHPVAPWDFRHRRTH